MTSTIDKQTHLEIYTVLTSVFSPPRDEEILTFD